MHRSAEHNLSPDRGGFTFVEVLIVVTILSILAMIVVPKFAQSQNEAAEAAIVSDLNLVRRQIELYKVQHGGRQPWLNQFGQIAGAEFVARMTGRTTSEGMLDANGEYGPYLSEWPTNPFADSSIAQKIKFGNNPVSPRDGTSGWYFSYAVQKIYVNSETGAESIN